MYIVGLLTMAKLSKNLCCLRKLSKIYLLNNIIFLQRHSHTYTAEETNSITRCIHRLPKDLLDTVIV